MDVWITARAIAIMLLSFLMLYFAKSMDNVFWQVMTIVFAFMLQVTLLGYLLPR